MFRSWIRLQSSSSPGTVCSTLFSRCEVLLANKGRRPGVSGALCKLDGDYRRVLRLDADVDVGVDVGRAAEVPDESGSFESPDVPDFVLGQIALLVKGQVEFVEPAGLLQHGRHFVHVLLAVRLENRLDRLFDQLLLIARQLPNSQSGEFSGGALKQHSVFAGGFLQQSFFALGRVQGRKDLVGFLRLVVV